jgi:acylglycerol lipase
MTMKARVALALVLLVGACAGGAPQWPDLQSPIRAWEPADEVRAQIIALHGINDHKGAFRDFAAYAAQRGILVRAYDQPGFGEAAGRGFWPGQDRLTAELEAQIALARAEMPATPIFVMGESMGAAVTVVTLTGDNAPEVDGMILLAPAVWGGTSLNPFYRLTLSVVSNIFPGMSFTGRGLGIQASDNVEMLRALGRDPLYIKQTRADTIAGLVGMMDGARAAGPELDGPILVLTGERDAVVRPEIQKSFAATIGSDRCTIISYADGWHLLLRDLQGRRVWEDVLAWIEGAPLFSTDAQTCHHGTQPASEPVSDWPGVDAMVAPDPRPPEETG